MSPKWDTITEKEELAKPFKDEAVKKLVEELRQAGVLNKFRTPSATIPVVWTTPPRGHELDAWEKKQVEGLRKAEEENLVRFMQECRERTTDMKDSEKCEHCKLRFRCYTEIKTEKKIKTKTKKRSGSRQKLPFRPG